MPAKRPKKATIKDIAKEAGVSHATVSMVFTGEQRISDATREKVMAIAREMKYVPNLGASNLRSGKTKLIGFIVNDLSNPSYGKMAQCAEVLAAERGYQLIIADHQWAPEAERAAIEKMISFQVRGLLLCSTERSKAAMELLNEPGSPVVVAMDSYPANYKGAFVGCDVQLSGKLAARHLIEAGCRKPVLFTVQRDLSHLGAFVELEKGFFHELAASGIPKKEHRTIYSGLTVESGQRAFHQMRATIPDVDGILCINDLCAYGAIAAADSSGVEIGKDIALMGIGDHFLSRMPRISLTTLKHPPDEVVRMAMDELIASFEQNRQPAVRYSIPPELIIRRSSRLER